MKDDLTIRLAEFFDSLKEALERLDARRNAARCGYPCFMLTDEFAGAVGSADELVRGLSHAYQFYRQLDLAHVTYEIIEHEELTNKLIQANVRWSFYDSNEGFLYDADYQYLLREDFGTLRAYVIVSINEQRRLHELTLRRAMERMTMAGPIEHHAAATQGK